jgi:hypothetical protein
MLPDITTPQRKLTHLGQLALLHVRIKELANVRDGVKMQRWNFSAGDTQLGPLPASRGRTLAGCFVATPATTWLLAATPDI